MSDTTATRWNAREYMSRALANTRARATLVNQLERKRLEACDIKAQRYDGQPGSHYYDPNAMTVADRFMDEEQEIYNLIASIDAELDEVRQVLRGMARYYAVQTKEHSWDDEKYGCSMWSDILGLAFLNARANQRIAYSIGINRNKVAEYKANAIADLQAKGPAFYKDIAMR